MRPSFALFLTILVFPYYCFCIAAVGCPGAHADYARLKKCHTYKDFCSSAFDGDYGTQTVKHVRFTTVTTTGPGTSTTTTTVTKKSVTSTITKIFQTETSTVGKRCGIQSDAVYLFTPAERSVYRTTTVNQCSTRVTCDAATFTERFTLQSACGCLVLPTHSVTYTHTVYLPLTVLTNIEEISSTTSIFPMATTTVDVATHVTCATVPLGPQATDCSNKGASYARYHIQKGDTGNDASFLTDWDPAVYKTRPPTVQNTTGFIGGFLNVFDKEMLLAYGHKFPGRNNFIDTRGYLYAAQTGMYNLVIQQLFLKGLIWIGDVAYSGWNISNTVLIANGTTSTHFVEGFANVLVPLVAGNYYPLRVGYAVGNLTIHDSRPCPYGDYCDNFYFSIIQPDGKLAEGAYSDDGYAMYNYYDHYGYDVKELKSSLIQFSCDGTTAPKFPPFGHET